MRKKILITGAGSYIGTCFEKYMLQWPDEYIIDTIDMKDGSWREKSFSGYDVIFHVAGIAHVSADVRFKELYYKVNRDLAIETAQKAKLENVKQFIFMSSIIVYGADEPIGRDKVITMETEPSPADFYGDSKLQADIAIQKLADEKFTVSILRPPMIYGPGCKGNFPKLLKFAKYALLFPDIRNKRSMLSIFSFNQFVRSIIDTENSGVFFPHDTGLISTTQIIFDIREIKGKRTFLIKIPGFLTLLLSKIKIFNKIFGNKFYKITANELNVASFKDNLRIILSERAGHER